MSAAASFTWIATVVFGLVLLVIWLMEYDRDFQSAAATRLPVPVISAHALLGIGGLMVWVLYLVGDEKRLALATVGDLGVVAVLGLVMAARWVGVYRAYAAPGTASARLIATVPPERHFPRPVVVVHGVLAVTTVILVLFTVLFD